MPKNQILGFEPAARFEKIAKEQGELEDRNIALNDAMILPYSANLDRMGFSERTTIEKMSERDSNTR